MILTSVTYAAHTCTNLRQDIRRIEREQGPGIDLLRTTGTYQSIVEEYRYLANGRFSRAREYQRQ